MLRPSQPRSRRGAPRSRHARRALVAAVLLGSGLATTGARADACPAPADAPAVAQLGSAERLEFLARAFDREIHDVDVWSWTWGSVYTAGTIAQAAALPLTHDRGARTDLTVGVISTAVGAVSLYGLPLQLTLPLRASRRRWDDTDRCAVLARAERTLVSVESDQALANGLLAHLGNVAVNAGIALILGLGYGRWTSAALSGGVGVAVGEANAFTQPHHLRGVLARYRSGQLAEPAGGLAWSLRPVVAGGMSGALLTVAW